MNRLPLLLTILAITTIAYSQSKMFNAPAPAEDPAPRSAAAIDAKAKYDFAIKQAHEAFVKQEISADQAYVDALKSAEDAQLKKGLDGEDEAGRIKSARLAATAAMDAHRKSVDHSQWFVGTKWMYEGQQSAVIEYQPNGVASGSCWHGLGKWSFVDDNTILQTEPEGNVIRVTFSSDRKAALWQYQNNGNVHSATAVPPQR
jgi:hypothetical protein